MDIIELFREFLGGIQGGAIKVLMAMYDNITMIGIIGVGSTFIGFMIRKFITESAMDNWNTTAKYWINAFLFPFGKAIGVTVTLGLSKWKFTKPFWNKVIEPTVIILLNLLLSWILYGIHKIISGIIEGLKSDNESFKGKLV